MHVHMKLWRHLNVHFAHVVCPSSCQCFCILSAVVCLCLALCVCMCVQCSQFSVCVCVCVCVCRVQHDFWFTDLYLIIPSMCVLCVYVCAGRYCRSTCSCRISCKEHEPPGNAQKHQHWWHQHKSAKFTLLQIVAARSWACRCQPMFTVMQSVYQNLKLLTFIKTIHLEGTVWFDTPCSGCYVFVFPIKKRVFYVFFFFFLICWKEKFKYLFISGTFLLPRWGLALDV